MADREKLKEVYVELSARDRKLQEGLRRAGRALERFGRKAGALGSKLKTYAKIFGGIGAAIAVGVVRHTQNAIDEQSKLARQIGATTKSIQIMDRAADLAGVGKINKQLSLLTRALGEAETGTGIARNALKRLGLEAKEINKLNVDQRVIAIAEAIQKAGLTAAETANIWREFTLRGTQFSTLIEDGGAAIKRARAEVEKYNLAVSDTDAQKIERANDAWGETKLAIKAIINQVAVATAPFLEVLSKAAADSLRSTKDLKPAIHDVIMGVAKLVFWAKELAKDFFGDDDAIEKKERQLMELSKALAQARGELGFTIGSISFGYTDQEAAFIHSLEGAISDLRGEMEGMGYGLTVAERVDKQMESLAETLQKVDEEAAVAAESLSTVADAQQQLSDSFPIDPGKQITAFKDLMDKMRGGMEEQIALERESYQRRLEEIDKFNEEYGIRTDERMELEKAAQEEHFRKLAEIRDSYTSRELTQEEQWGKQRADFERKGAKEKARILTGAFSDTLNSVQTHSKTLFQVQKAASIANAVVSTHEAFNKALAAYPPPWNYALAGAVAVAGIARVQAIARTSIGGGSSASSAGGSGASAQPSGIPSSQQGLGAARQNELHVSITGLSPGELFSRDAVQSLIESINEQIQDGAQIGSIRVS